MTNDVSTERHEIAPIDAVTTHRTHPVDIAGIAGKAILVDLSVAEVQQLMGAIQQVSADATMRGASVVLDAVQKAANKRLLAARLAVEQIRSPMNMGWITRAEVLRILDTMIHTRPGS